MKLLNTEFVYEANGLRYTDRSQNSDNFAFTCEITDTSIRASVTAKKPLTMKRADLDFSYPFKEGDKFFGNGYQSWTTSREYTAADKMKPITPIAKGRLKYLAGISADTRFVDFPTRAGSFVSHCYTYIKSEDGVTLLGSLTERQGFTVFYADMPENHLTISKDVEGVTLQSGETYDLFDVVILKGTYDEVFDAYFKAMGVKKPVVEHMSGYTSWYNYFQKIDEKIILRDLNALDMVKDSVSVFQVDDGYETFVGDWTDKNPAKFPRGMKFIADSIHDKGYLAGIWIAPFSVQIKSETYKKHPDWVVKYPNGKPILGVVAWGGAYTLDIYNEDARAYIKSFFDTVLCDWGYDMANPEHIVDLDMVGTGYAVDAFGEVMAEGGAGLIISSQAAYMYPIPNDIELQLVNTPTAQLKDVKFIQEVAMQNSGFAYMIAKRMNHLQAQRAAATSWRKRRARINTISPGVIVTPLAYDEFNANGEGYQRMIDASAAQRTGTSDEIAEAAAFLLGDHARFITGTDLLIDGGVIAAIRTGEYKLG